MDEKGGKEANFITKEDSGKLEQEVIKILILIGGHFEWLGDG